MARSIPVIYNQLLAAKNAQSALSGLNSTSQVSIWNLWLWITAVGQNLFEQLCDLFITTIEGYVANATVYSASWIVYMIKQFQYSSSSPQVRIVSTTPPFTLNYPVIMPTLQVIANAAVVTVGNRSLLIKVSGAAGAALSSPQLTALQSDMNNWMIPGTQFTLQSYTPDLIYIAANVYYNASYSGVIQANMDAALTAFFIAIPYNGVFEVSQLEAAMLVVTGVQDVVLNNVWIQSAAQNNTNPPPDFSQGTYLIQDNTVLLRNYQPIAGSVIEITPSMYNWDSTIIYNAV